MPEGLYAITPDGLATPELLQRVEAALRGGAATVQYRNKQAGPALRLEQAQALKTLCGQFSVPLLINDHVDLAARINADGVHLGAEDGSIAAARLLLGKSAIIGASCYDQLALAEQALAEGANYVAFGAVFASPTKPDARHAPLELFGLAARRFSCPTVAIGGITLNNAGQLVAAGAKSVAVISALFDATDIEATARQFSAAFAA